MTRTGRGIVSTLHRSCLTFAESSRHLDTLPSDDLIEDHSRPPGTHRKSRSPTQTLKDKGDVNLRPLALDWLDCLAK
jgi:hypothetical protein